MKTFSDDIEPLLAVVAATLAPTSELIEANAGFLRLLGASGVLPEDGEPVGARLSRFFIQPSFAAFAAAAPNAGGGPVYAGLMTVGNRTGAALTLRARVWQHDGDVRILAEHDIAELEQVSRSIQSINTDSTRSQISLGLANLDLRQREASLMSLSLTDELTGLGNRRMLEKSLAIELSRVQRSGTPLSVIILDIDFFKLVNDRYGHGVGDQVLIRFGTLLSELLRPTDIITRFGGEEFVVLLPHTALDGAAAAAERIRGVLALEIVEPLIAPVTASCGVAELAPGEAGLSLIERADQALYRAKYEGRNRVVTAPASAGQSGPS